MSKMPAPNFISAIFLYRQSFCGGYILVSPGVYVKTKKEGRPFGGDTSKEPLITIRLHSHVNNCRIGLIFYERVNEYRSN